MANLIIGLCMLFLAVLGHTLMPFGITFVMLLVGGINAILGMLDIMIGED